jgi:hypothetical protein
MGPHPGQVPPHGPAQCPEVTLAERFPSRLGGQAARDRLRAPPSLLF